MSEDRRPSRRRRLAPFCLAAVAVGPLLGLVACGSDASPDSPAPAASSAAAASYPVTITHKLGTAEIKTAPTRVVALGLAEAEATIALGVTPVGISRSPFDADGVYPWLRGKVDPAKTTLLLASGSDASYDIEQIAALRPDLILAPTDFSIDAQYDKLSKLAPTVAYQKGLLRDSWEDVTGLVGKALGQPDKAAALVSSTNAAITRVKSDNPGAQGRTYAFGLASSAPALALTVSPEDFSDRLFSQIGLSLAPAVKALPVTPGAGAALLSFEQLGTLEDTDLLLVTYLVPTAQQTLEGLTAFSSLPAVTAKHYQALPPATATALRNPGPLSVVWSLDQISPVLQSLGG